MQIGFFGLLGLVFIVLKLVGYIDWAWVWVLAPLWGVAVLVFIIITIGALYSMVSGRSVRFYARKKK